MVHNDNIVTINNVSCKNIVIEDCIFIYDILNNKYIR